MKKILAVGAVFVDIKGYPLASFDPKGRNVGHIEYVHGGVMRNVAEDIAHCGYPVSLLSVLDGSSLSYEVISRLEESGVDTRFIEITKDGLGTWLAIFDDSGDVVSSISKRPVLLPIIDILKEHGKEIMEECEAVCLDISDEREMLEEVLQWAKKYDRPVYGGVSNMTEGVRNIDLMSQLDCLVCNKQEAGILFETDLEECNSRQVLEFVKQHCAEHNISSMVVTMGANGACYISEKEEGICSAYLARVEDTTGAGDAFFAGLSLALNAGKNLDEASHVGAYLAARTISTTDSVCPPMTLKEFDL